MAFSENNNSLKTVRGAFENAIAQISDSDDRVRAFSRIAFLIDEFDTLLQLEEKSADKLFSRLRVVFHDQPISRRLALVLAGSSRPYVVTRQESSPLFMVTTTVVLQPFARDEAEKLVRKGCQSADNRSLWTEANVQLVLDATGGHPYLVQYVMRRLYDLPVPEVTGRHIQETLIELNQVFEEWYSKLDEKDRGLYGTLSVQESQQGLSVQQLRRLVPGASTSILSWITTRLLTLQSTGVVREWAGGSGEFVYAAAGRAFQRMVSKPSDVKSAGNA